jgi:hypothetical protein
MPISVEIGNANNHFGTGTFIYKEIISAVKKVELLQRLERDCQ